MSFILGQKMKMSQRFNEAGQVIPVTAIKIMPCTVTQLKTVAKDGYLAVQIGGGVRKKINKALKGQLKELGSFRYLKEFIVGSEEFKRGQLIDINALSQGEKVKITGTSKGKGFQGVVKRHGFHGSPASHGHKDQLRMPGSIGSKRIGPVAKGKRMAGRMGTDRVTVHNLEIIDLDKENSLLYLKGAVPGVRQSLIIIQSEKK